MSLSPIKRASAKASELTDKAHELVDTLNDEKALIQNRVVQTKSTLAEILLGDAYGLRRLVLAYSGAFIVSTAVRVICISPRFPVFGNYLANNLGPIERDDASWLVVATTRIIDLAIATVVYNQSGNLDAPLVGLLLTLISRPPVLQAFHHHFLLSNKTVTQILLTDIFAQGAALGVISRLLPRAPSFRPAPASWIKRHLNNPDMQTVFVALGLGLLTNGLLNFVGDRLYLHSVMKAGVLDHMVPAYFAKIRPTAAFMQKHPLLPVPTLRTDFKPLNMAEAITYGAPYVVCQLVLSLFVLPSQPIANLSIINYLLCAPSTFLTIWNLLPVTAWASAILAFDIGIRQTVVIALISWVLQDLRRPVTNRVFVAHSKRIVGSEIDGSKLVQEEITTM